MAIGVGVQKIFFIVFGGKNETPVLNKEDAEANLNKDFKCYVITEPCDQVTEIKIPVLINELNNEEATLDTASGLNLIKEEFLLKNNLKITESKPVKVLFGNNKTEETQMTIQLNIRLKDTR